MTHGIVTINQGHGGTLFNNFWRALHIDAAIHDAPCILRQPHDAMTIGALQVGRGHEMSNSGSIAGVQPKFLKGLIDEMG